MKGLRFLLVLAMSTLLLGVSFPAGSEASSDSLYVDFGGAGIWEYGAGAWTLLTGADPLSMSASGSLFYANFGAAGLWKYDGTTWTLLTSSQPTRMVAAGPLLYADFGPLYGVWMYDGTTWIQLASANAQDMTIPVNPNIITDTDYNTAIGINALQSNTTGHDNTASNDNTASGYRALYQNTIGNENTANGHYALYNAQGYANTALGKRAGYNGNPSDVFTGSFNIYVGWQVNPGSLTESYTMRLGSSSVVNKAFIAGIYNANIGSGSIVYINSSGQLGTAASSRRYK